MRDVEGDQYLCCCSPEWCYRQEQPNTVAKVEVRPLLGRLGTSAVVGKMNCFTAKPC